MCVVGNEILAEFARRVREPCGGDTQHRRADRELLRPAGRNRRCWSGPELRATGSTSSSYESRSPGLQASSTSSCASCAAATGTILPSRSSSCPGRRRPSTRPAERHRRACAGHGRPVLTREVPVPVAALRRSWAADGGEPGGDHGPHRRSRRDRVPGPLRRRVADGLRSCLEDPALAAELGAKRARASPGVLFAPGRPRALDAALRRAGGWSIACLDPRSSPSSRTVTATPRCGARSSRPGSPASRASFTELRRRLGSRASPSPTRRSRSWSRISATLTSSSAIRTCGSTRVTGSRTCSRPIRDLEGRDDRWAVAGNAGGSRALRVIRSVTDPHGGGTGDPLPAGVHSLDENFLVIRTGTGVRCSPQLSGFHLYGTDLCLNALEQGRQPYVIDFRLRHLEPRDQGRGYVRRATAGQPLELRVPLRATCGPRRVLFLGRWGSRAVLGSAGSRARQELPACPAGRSGHCSAPRSKRAPKRNSTAGSRVRF